MSTILITRAAMFRIVMGWVTRSSSARCIVMPEPRCASVDKAGFYYNCFVLAECCIGLSTSVFIQTLYYIRLHPWNCFKPCFVESVVLVRQLSSVYMFEA
jgi:hypothetical protein